MTGAHRVFPGASSFQRAIGAAKKRGRKLKWVDADGNCFFYAVALQLMFLGLLTARDYFEGGQKLREQVLEFVRSNEALYRQYISEDETWEGFMADLSKSGCWKKVEVVLNALALMYKGAVFSASNGPCTTE